MAVRFTTSAPEALFNKFYENIKNDEIHTWEIVEKKNELFFTHTAKDHYEKAYFHAELTQNELIFYISSYKNESINSFEYAYYHGHLIETFVFHFSKYFSTGTVTSLPDNKDLNIVHP